MNRTHEKQFGNLKVVTTRVGVSTNEKTNPAHSWCVTSILRHNPNFALEVIAFLLKRNYSKELVMTKS